MPSSIAPTVSAVGSLPGLVIVPKPLPMRPSLPAATTTRMPLSYALRTAWHIGSVRYDSNTGWPSDRFRTRML